MRAIPPKLKQELAGDPEYKLCLRELVLRDHLCGGRITWEHAIIYAGRQVNARWAIVPICAYAHSVDGYQDRGILDKEINVWLALNRATDDELDSYERANFREKRDALNAKRGIPDLPTGY